MSLKLHPLKNLANESEIKVTFLPVGSIDTDEEELVDINPIHIIVKKELIMSPKTEIKKNTHVERVRSFNDGFPITKSLYRTKSYDNDFSCLNRYSIIYASQDIQHMIGLEFDDIDTLYEYISLYNPIKYERYTPDMLISVLRTESPLLGSGKNSPTELTVNA